MEILLYWKNSWFMELLYQFFFLIISCTVLDIICITYLGQFRLICKCCQLRWRITNHLTPAHSEWFLSAPLRRRRHRPDVVDVVKCFADNQRDGRWHRLPTVISLLTPTTGRGLLSSPVLGQIFDLKGDFSDIKFTFLTPKRHTLAWDRVVWAIAR